MPKIYVIMANRNSPYVEDSHTFVQQVSTKPIVIPATDANYEYYLQIWEEGANESETDIMYDDEITEWNKRFKE